VFEVPFQAPQVGEYELVLRPHRRGGGTVFGADRARVATPFEAWGRYLVLLPPRNGKTAPGNPVQAIYEGVLEGRQETANFLVPASDSGLYADSLLARYLDRDRAVLWAGRHLSRTLQEGLVRYLDRQGSLLISTSASPWSWSKSLLDRLPWRGWPRAGSRRWPARDRWRPSGSPPRTWCSRDWRDSAQPLFVDADGKTRGWWRRTDRPAWCTCPSICPR